MRSHYCRAGGAGGGNKMVTRRDLTASLYIGGFTAADKDVIVAFQEVPGGGNKMVVRRDAATSLYISLANMQTASGEGFDQRNILQLLTSPNLVSWCVFCARAGVQKPGAASCSAPAQRPAAAHLARPGVVVSVSC